MRPHSGVSAWKPFLYKLKNKGTEVIKNIYNNKSQDFRNAEVISLSTVFPRKI